MHISFTTLLQERREGKKRNKHAIFCFQTPFLSQPLLVRELPKPLQISTTALDPWCSAQASYAAIAALNLSQL